MINASPNKRVSDSGFQPSPKSPSATSDTHRALYPITLKTHTGGKKDEES